MDPQTVCERDVAAPNQTEGPVVVGIGASAGGLEAVQRFLKHMPPDSGMAFVLVQHLDPGHESILSDLLAHHTKIPIEQIRDDVLAEADHAYVIPPNASLTIDRGVLRLGPSPAHHGVRTPIDVFLKSLAQDRGEKAVGIILSGTGSDGTIGLRAIKNSGGLTIAQSPKSAAHDSMPQSAIAAGVADGVLTPEEMPARLIEHIRHLEQLGPAEVPGGRDEELPDYLTRIRAIVQRKTGHDFNYYKQNTLVRRIRRRMDTLRLINPAEYELRLEQDPQEAEELLKELLINVTEFFRDPEAFESLAHSVIPKLFEGRNPADQVRLWVVGCASGEEAYSFAILLREQMARMETAARAQIFATDIDEQALASARQGRYPHSIAERISPERLERFFIKEDGTYRVCPELRDMCVFSRHNVIQDPPFMSLDLVSCRNMLIYLKSDIGRELTTLFHYAIRPGGYLFLGSAETIAGQPELFEALDRKQRIFQRRNIVVRAPARLPLSRFRGHQPGVVPSGLRESDMEKSLERLLLDQYLPAGAVVKEQGDIVYLFGLTGKYLEPSAGAPSLNVLSLARKELRLHLRASLHKAATRKESVSDPGIVLQIDQQRQVVKLTVRPVTELEPDSGLYLVIFQEMALADQELEPREEVKGDDAVVQQLHEELRTTSEQLQETIEELETANEELLSGNEELLSVNEELQSSNEELQSSKEELQSLNAELSTRVEELEDTRNDLQNLFESTRIATVFLDNDLCIKRFTPVSTELFRLREGDVGRPITDIATRFIDGDISESIREVLRTLQHKEVSIERAEGNRRYILRIMPYRTLNNTIDGVTLAFVDVTDLKRAEEAGRASEERFRTAVENLLDAFMISSAVRDEAGKIVDFRIEYVNEAACTLNQRTREQQVGRRLLEIFPDLGETGLFDVYRRVAETGEPATREGFTFKIAALPRRTYDMRVTKLDDGFALAWRDVTERYQALEGIREANRRKDEFLAMLSHELRNPLAAIAASIHLWRRRGSEDPQLERARDVAERQSRHMTRLLDDLLELARITRGQIVLHRQQLDLSEVAEAAVRAVTPLAEARQQQLSLSLPVEPVRVEGDPDRLAQAVGNLLNNAVKYTPPGGHIWLGVQRADAQAIVRVRDDGIGIQPEIMPHIFELFVQADASASRSQGGLGLGLTLVKRLVEMHGGSVDASSEGKDKGSEFILRLPLLTETDIVESTLAAEKPVAEIPKRILIIDDNADSSEMLAMLLQMDGHEVMAADNGQKAIAMAINHRPDIILLDIGMPGMDGYEVAHRFREDPALSGKVIVALTGYGQREDQERSRRAGFDYHLVKPVDMEALRRVLRGETQGIE